MSYAKKKANATITMDTSISTVNLASALSAWKIFTFQALFSQKASSPTLYLSLSRENALNVEKNNGKNNINLKIMNGLYTIILLVFSNIFMTLAWYGHLKLQQTGVSSNWPLIGVIAFSWAIAFFEYCCQVPANRIGFIDNGGPFTLVQLKVIQECISLIIFAIIANMLFQGQGLHWNHFAAFGCLIAAVYFVFMK